jgi:MFS family permease
MILFIFAVTSGSPKGWGTAYVLAPLIISLFIFAAFLYWESRIDPDDAVLPPRMWRFRNFGVLVGLALLPYLWYVTYFINLTAWWEEVFGWSAVKTAVHFLPLGIGAWLIAIFTGQFPKWFPHKYILLVAVVFTIAATALAPFGDSPDRYWRFMFPSFVLGTFGTMVIFANSSIAIFSYTPPSVAGTVGAVFNCALQLGSAVGLAAVSSISNSVDKKANQAIFTIPISEWSHQLGNISRDMWKEAFKGRAAAFWFLFAVLGVEAVAVIVFFKVDLPTPEEKKEDSEMEKKDVEASPVMT